VSPDDWIAAENEADQRRFQPIAAENEADQRRFKSFVRRIPKPTTLQSLKAMTVEDVWIRVAVWTVIIVLSAAAVAFLVSGGWSA
jgi:hypothetical protein